MATLSAKDYAAQADAKKQELTDKVLDYAKSFQQSPETLVEYLKFQSSFYRYSTNNTMLIHFQNPGALYCGSFQHFKDKGYSVKKGEHGMQVLVPTRKTFLVTPEDDKLPLSEATKEQKQAYKEGKIESFKRLYFKVGTVFDITQTNCPKEDYPKLLDLGYSSEQHAELFKTVKEYSEKELNCPVEEDAYSSVSLRGYFSPADNKICISGNFDDTTKLSILTHELGHAIMHNAAQTAENGRPPTAQIEFEADAVSIMLYKKFSLEPSESRLRHLSDSFKDFQNTKDFNSKMITDSLEKAHKAFNQVSEYLDNNMSQEQTQQQTQTADTPQTEPILPNQIPDVGGMVQAM